MRIKPLGLLFALPLVALSFAATAQTPSPIGRWKTFDDETGKAMSVTEVYVTKSGDLAAKVVETLNTPNATCTKCSGAKKNKPIVGMMVFWNVRKSGDDWGNGQGFKPSTGDSFKVKSVKLLEGGNKLEITGCKLVFCRSANWARVD